MSSFDGARSVRQQHDPLGRLKRKSGRSLFGLKLATVRRATRHRRPSPQVQDAAEAKRERRRARNVELRLSDPGLVKR